jgi:hypothetical protein
MLNKFIDWATKIANKSAGKDAVAWVTESEISSNPSARLDIDTSAAVARITCWESGDYDAEIIHLESGRTIFSIHGNLQPELDFSGTFADFFKSLND